MFGKFIDKMSEERVNESDIIILSDSWKIDAGDVETN